MGLEFVEDLAQTLLNAINRMKERTPVDLQTFTAESPVSTQQEMVAEDLLFFPIQMTEGDELKIGHIFLELTGIGTPAVSPLAGDQGDLTHVLLPVRALAEAPVTGAKDGAQHAIAGDGFITSEKAKANSETVFAAFRSQSHCEYLVPFHGFSTPLIIPNHFF